jgi:hypothetical protein
MNAVRMRLPLIDEIAAVLRNVTECMARELSAPQMEPLKWTKFEWRIAKAVATMQGLAPLLCSNGSWNGPPEWHEFLREQRHHVEQRQLRVARLLEEIDSSARNEGIALLPLKGSALHAMGIYAAGDRPMADIDLLMRAPDSTCAQRVLRACGYQPTFKNRRHEVYETQTGRALRNAYGEHAENPLKIELHSFIRERLPISEIDITEYLFPIDGAPGLNSYRSAGALMMHLLLHAANNMRANALRHIQLHDIALLSSRLDDNAWNDLTSARPSGQDLWWAVPPLVLTSRYYPSAIPNSVIARLEPACTGLLRKRCRRFQLTDVSWSNIRVQALPGVEWSRSPWEALRFMVRRAIPDRELRAEFRRFHDSHDSSSNIRWYGLSQSSRIVRWILGRPPRVQTLSAVLAVLEDARGPDAG